MNLRKLLMNDTESRFGTTSNAIPLLDAYIYIVSPKQNLRRVKLLVFEMKIDSTYSGPKFSIPVVKNTKVPFNLNLVKEGVAG